uniref:Uncharacterized protein n=1 Tax=Anguilla anguilla TaxID=7936 RepID=A0A0E9U0C3_ANGAN
MAFIGMTGAILRCQSTDKFTDLTYNKRRE